MNLWFRLIWLLLSTPWRKRASVLDTTVIRLRVLPNDLDWNGHVNNGRYLSLADLGRLDFFLRTGAARVALSRRTWPLVGDAMAKFRKDLRLLEGFELHTRLLGWDDKWGFMEHRFVRQGRVAGIVVVRGVFRSAQGNVPPGMFLADLGVPEKSPVTPGWLIEWNESCETLAAELRAEEGRAAGG